MHSTIKTHSPSYGFGEPEPYQDEPKLNYTTFSIEWNHVIRLLYRIVSLKSFRIIVYS